jgi:hypothetical protein
MLFKINKFVTYIIYPNNILRDGCSYAYFHKSVK